MHMWRLTTIILTVINKPETYCVETECAGVQNESMVLIYLDWTRFDCIISVSVPNEGTCED